MTATLSAPSALPFEVQNLGDVPVSANRPGRKTADNPFLSLIDNAWQNRKGGDGVEVSDTLQIIVPNVGNVSEKTGRYENVTAYMGQIRAAAYSMELGVSLNEFRCDPKGKAKEAGSMTAIRFRVKVMTKRTRKAIVEDIPTDENTTPDNTGE